MISKHITRCATALGLSLFVVCCSTAHKQAENEQAEKDIASLNYCDKDADCTFEPGECEDVAFNKVEKKNFERLLKIASQYTEDGGYQACSFSNSCQSVKCVNKKCILKDCQGTG